jgi:hypothetical protein
MLCLLVCSKWTQQKASFEDLLSKFEGVDPTFMALVQAVTTGLSAASQTQIVDIKSLVELTERFKGIENFYYSMNFCSVLLSNSVY